MGPRRHRAVDFLDGEGGRPDRKALSYVCHRSCPITFIAFLCGDLPLLFVCSHLLPSLTIKQEHQSLCCCDNRPTWTPSRPPFPLPSVHTGFPNWLDQPVDSDPLSAAAQSGDLADEYELRPLYVPSFMAALLHLGIEPPWCEVGWKAQFHDDEPNCGADRGSGHVVRSNGSLWHQRNNQNRKNCLIWILDRMFWADGCCIHFVNQGSASG